MTHPAANTGRFIDAAIALLERHATEVAALDQAIGDGDHLINLQRGLRALQAESASLDEMDWPAALNRMGRIVMTQVGGASGSLYATLFMAMSRVLQEPQPDRSQWAHAFAHGVEAARQRGQSGEGEKTLMDVWMPVARVLAQGASEQWPEHTLHARLNETAAAGCVATRDLIATRGRASFLGERARGHIDPGARTSQLLLESITTVLAETHQGSVQ